MDKEGGKEDRVLEILYFSGDVCGLVYGLVLYDERKM